MKRLGLIRFGSPAFLTIEAILVIDLGGLGVFKKLAEEALLRAAPLRPQYFMVEI